MIEAVGCRARQLLRLGTYYMRYFSIGAAADGNRGRNIRHVAELTAAGQRLQKTDLRSRRTKFVSYAERLGRGDNRRKGGGAAEHQDLDPFLDRVARRELGHFARNHRAKQRFMVTTAVLIPKAKKGMQQARRPRRLHAGEQQTIESHCQVVMQPN